LGASEADEIIKNYDEELCLQIARQMMIPETSFLKPLSNQASCNEWYIRWWSPKFEVKFCGHATLAAAHILFSENFADENKEIKFHTKLVGELIVKISKNNNDVNYILNFPSTPYSIINCNIINKLYISKLLGFTNSNDIIDLIKSGEDIIIILKHENLVIQYQPNISQIAQLKDYRCIIITAPNENQKNILKCDFVCRVFAPKLGIDEDAVSGRVHCGLVTYWSDILNQRDSWLTSYQASLRGGIIHCKYDTKQERSLLKAKARTCLSGTMRIGDENHHKLSKL